MMRAGAALLFLGAALMLTACEEAEPGAPQANGTASTDADTPQPARIDPSRLPGRTPFTLPAVQQAFPGLEVVAVLEDPARGELPRFDVRAPGDTAPLYRLTPDWTRGLVGEVATDHPAISGPGGLQTGTTRRAEALAALNGAPCEPLTGPGAPPFACEANTDGAVLRLEFAGEAADAVLVRLVWLPALP
ncbi:hypothetical protein [Hyphomonas sp.]|uniref:hypothetical protein n=1 Tax=Hyphomonas sp. TaxID=87 RepID=UPI00391BCD29